jgi:hypothetical protein
MVFSRSESLRSRARMSRLAFWSLTLVGSAALAQQASQPAAVSLSSRSALVHLSSSDTRMKAHDVYFGLEDQRIRARRSSFGFETPAEGRAALTIGIAMSGGGIRSNAFHTGLLAGLHAEKFHDASLLDRIDYSSSVSGGSWANAAMWAWPGELADLYECLDAGAFLGKANALKAHPECKDALEMLRTEQKVKITVSPGNQRKEAWRRAISSAHLKKGCDVFLDQPMPHDCTQNVVRRPYFIINSTHSARTESPGIDGFPIETTFDSMATVIDIGSGLPATGGNRGPTGFVLGFDAPTARWERRKFFAARIPGGSSGLQDGTQLSLIAAHSSAVVKGAVVPAMFFSFYFQISDGPATTQDAALRDEYKITDGGKSDNTGLVPLIERGVDLVVASYMGKESDPKPFGDFLVADGQIKKLFDCQFSPINTTAAHPRLQSGTYTCPKASSRDARQVLHLHPWPNNIEDFMQSLESRAKRGERGLADLIAFLKSERTQVKDPADRFPQSPTFKTKYDERLIRAYYLLGRFCAQTDLAPALRARLAGG